MPCYITYYYTLPELIANSNTSLTIYELITHRAFKARTLFLNALPAVAMFQKRVLALNARERENTRRRLQGIQGVSILSKHRDRRESVETKCKRLEATANGDISGTETFTLSESPNCSLRSLRF